LTGQNQGKEGGVGCNKKKNEQITINWVEEVEKSGKVKKKAKKKKKKESR